MPRICIYSQKKFFNYARNDLRQKVTQYQREQVDFTYNVHSLNTVAHNTSRRLMSWLNTKYFALATVLMGILQGVKVVEGNADPISALIVSLIGGVFWGAIFTAIAKLFKKP